MTHAVVSMPGFRPLIGSDKADIVATARRIGTFEISIEPYEDCCTVFTPKHPRTHPHLQALEEAELALDCEALIDESFENARVRLIGGPAQGKEGSL